MRPTAGTLPLDTLAAARQLRERPLYRKRGNRPEGVIDEVHAALAVRRRLDLGEAPQSGNVDAAELAIDVGGLHVQICKRGDGARIFACPVEGLPEAGALPPICRDRCSCGS